MERTKRGLLLAKTEATYAVDPIPTATANVITTMRGEVTFSVETDSVIREILDGGIGQVAGENAMPRIKLNFKCELRGNRTDGVTADISKGAIANAIELDPLLQACDMAATYTAETTNGARDGFVTYKPTIPTDQGKGVTFWFYTEKKLHKVVGCKGTFKISLTAGKFGVIEFEFRGRWVLPIDNGGFPPNAVFQDTKPPLFQTSFTTLDAWGGATFDVIDCDLGNAVTLRPDANSVDAVAGFIITGRQSKGSINPESVAEGTHPVWNDFHTGKVKTLVTRLGINTGNMMTVTVSAQQRQVSYGDREGNRITPINFDIVRSALSTTLGNDFQLKFH
ncbi:MAG: hypothetical protein SFY81_04970 [Verrucomicrobiota bacterium]|nr:hypothetical protein [Verrucomicrobiota bacterium]